MDLRTLKELDDAAKKVGLCRVKKDRQTDQVKERQMCRFRGFSSDCETSCSSLPSRLSDEFLVVQMRTKKHFPAAGINSNIDLNTARRFETPKVMQFSKRVVQNEFPATDIYLVIFDDFKCDCGMSRMTR